EAGPPLRQRGGVGGGFGSVFGGTADCGADSTRWQFLEARSGLVQGKCAFWRTWVYLICCTSLRVSSLLHSFVKAFLPAFSKATVVQVTPTLTATQSPSGAQTPKVAVARGSSAIPPMPVPHQPIGCSCHFPARFNSTL